jgi:(E)-4-hydroxy-3-methylbut-2-enyl-diphosphate synthase
MQYFHKDRQQESQEVSIGTVPLGGGYPMRIQSMTDTDSCDTEATVSQIVNLMQAGADYVRIAVKSLSQAENLKNIQQALSARGIKVPLIADVHFRPNVAASAAKYVAKVRINSGNFYDRQTRFKPALYTEQTYRAELAKIEEQFSAFLKVLKKTHTALRIGANQGSLSDRILNRYGNTPAAMVESVMEFLRICKKQDFNNVVVSVKSSHTRTMIYANRLMYDQMRIEHMSYPLHLGITEAGEGEEARVKSAIGIGSLLVDRIGDTIRISLTEPPENEIPVAKKLIQYVQEGKEDKKYPLLVQRIYAYKRRVTHAVANIGGENPPVVMAYAETNRTQKIFAVQGRLMPEYCYNGVHVSDLEKNTYPVLSLKTYLSGQYQRVPLQFIHTSGQEFEYCLHVHPIMFEHMRNEKQSAILLESFSKNTAAEICSFFMLLEECKLQLPVILYKKYHEESYEDLQIKAAVDFGGICIDGYGDGLCIGNTNSVIDVTALKNLSFTILQESGMRRTRAEFISCPGCGRTSFDLHETAQKVKAHFVHLQHLKIGVMGCVVNGPGEMGDADYGLVGAGNNKVNLYKGKCLKKRHIHYAHAVDALEQLIREYNDWKEPVYLNKTV